MKFKTNTLIVGAGEAGEMLLSEYNKRNKAHYIIGFLDDDVQKIGTQVSGKEVLGRTADIHSIIGQHSVKQVIIAMPSAKTEVINNIFNQVMATRLDIAIHIIPRAEKFFDSVPLFPSIAEIQFADLFARDEYELNLELINKTYSGKTVLVTGAGGSIGSEICKQLLKFEVKKLVLVGRGENSIYDLIKKLKEYFALMTHQPAIDCRIADVKDYPLMELIFHQARPDIVFHAAAHKHVPIMEFNEIEAIQNNILGTKNILDLCCAFNVEKYIMVSTDKAVRPRNIMGATKRIAELLSQYYHTRKNVHSAIVRFGNVFGSRGSVIPLFKEQIEKGGPVTITHPDMSRYFMTIPEASLLVINAAAFSSGGEIFVLDMGKQEKVLDIARKMIRLYGMEPEKEIQIVYTGLRPGEKLTEELFYDKTRLSKTDNNRILLLPKHEWDIDAVRLEKFLELDLKNLLTLDRTAIRSMIKDLVPEYEYNYDGTVDALKIVY